MTLIHVFDSYIEDDTIMSAKCNIDNKKNPDAKIRTAEDFNYYIKNQAPPNHDLCKDCLNNFKEDNQSDEIDQDFILFRKKVSREELRTQEAEPTTIHIMNNEKSNDSGIRSLCGYKLAKKLSNTFENIDADSLDETNDHCKRCIQLFEN